MLINGKNITEYGKVKQWRVDIKPRKIEHDSEWPRGSPAPIFQTPFALFKEITITLMVYGSGREDILHRISDILAGLTDVTELVLDGWEHGFRGVLEESDIKELSDISRHRFQQLELQFSGYENGDEVTATANGTGTLQITNPGNMVSPAILELTPTIGAASVKITGLCRDSNTGEDLPVTVKNLTTGNKIVLDGITGLITENGGLKAGDVDMWELPTILPGNNTITIDTEYANLKVTVLPIYM